MNHDDQTFEWQQFSEGRACFSGGIRGWDERGHDTFAVEIDGRVVYGEKSPAFFSSNHNDYNIQVVSFGYGMRESVGLINEGGPGPYAQGIFSPAYLECVQRLVAQLIRAGLRVEDRPAVITEYPDARFQGKLIFPVGWAVHAAASEIAV